MEYEVHVTRYVEEELTFFLLYLLVNKKSRQAAHNVNEDFLHTIKTLEIVAGAIHLDDDPDIAALGYKRIHFKKHNYFLVFHIQDKIAIVDHMFHDLQDYKSALISES